ncbi:MAG TPA: hypothetical protein VK599_17465 [Streptosporangiaceae bacterium]|jgi:hypothetical protein|nr:hypothetical protein [Streptosporangiaceae bacterium]
MQIKQRARLRAGRLALVLAASAGVLAAIAPAAGASTAAPSAMAAASSPAFPSGTKTVFHTCQVIGHAGNYQAVHCADLLTTRVGTAGLEIWIQNEVLCQRTAAPNKGGLTACSGVHERVGYGVPGRTFAQPQQTCGKILGHSPCISSRTEHRFLASFVTLGSASAPACSIWAESVLDSVVLPTTGHPTVSARVVATPHFNYHIEAGNSCIEIPM